VPVHLDLEVVREYQIPSGEISRTVLVESSYLLGSASAPDSLRWSGVN
jgi:hypothetical protein